jgi:hypothetical protein
VGKARGIPLGDLKEMVLGGIRDWVVTTIVKKAITKVASMFNPVGAVIQAIIMVYDTIKFFIERFQQIAELANAVFESVANIAAGKVEAAAGYVEKTMARTIPVIVGFLASLIGLGGISQKIKDIIKSIQEKVETALSKLVSFIVGKVKGLLGKDKEGKPGKAETPEERWDNAVKGVKAALAQLEKEGISEEKVKAQLPKWKTDFGFKELSIDTKQKPWVIVGEMSPAKTVSTVEIKPIKPLLDGKDYERIRQGQLIDLDDYINPSGQQFPSRSLSPDYKSPKDTKNRTNAERAKAGRTPFLYNDDFVELHHTNQDFFSELDEHSHVFHQSVVDDPDYHPFAGDPGYMTWREWFGFYNGQLYRCIKL